MVVALVVKVEVAVVDWLEVCELVGVVEVVGVVVGEVEGDVVADEVWLVVCEDVGVVVAVVVVGVVVAVVVVVGVLVGVDVAEVVGLVVALDVAVVVSDDVGVVVVVGVVVRELVCELVAVVVGLVVGVVIWQVAKVPSKYEFKMAFNLLAVFSHSAADAPPRTYPPSWQFNRSSSTAPREYSVMAWCSDSTLEEHPPSVVSSVTPPEVWHASVPGSASSSRHCPMSLFSIRVCSVQSPGPASVHKYLPKHVSLPSAAAVAVVVGVVVGVVVVVRVVVVVGEVVALVVCDVVGLEAVQSWNAPTLISCSTSFKICTRSSQVCSPSSATTRKPASVHVTHSVPGAPPSLYGPKYSSSRSLTAAAAVPAQSSSPD